MTQRAGWVFLVCAAASAQVTVNEPATRARLVDGKTTIFLALDSSFSGTETADIELQWQRPRGAIHTTKRLEHAVPPGRSFFEVPLPLPDEGDPLHCRLRYSVKPLRQRAAPEDGVIAFPQLADYAFRLTTAALGQPRPGRRYAIPVSAAHPATGEPAPGVRVRLQNDTAITGADGSAVLHITPDPDEWGDWLEIAGHLGDVRQSAGVRPPPLPNRSVLIQTDKPLYQPGQTVRLRMLARGADGKAFADAVYSLRIHAESQIVLSTTLRTSPFGIASADWEIPPNAASGAYEIKVEHDDDDSPTVHRIEVRRYELPSFRVLAEPERRFFLLGQPLTVVLRGEYLFGKPLAGGKARIVREGSEETLAEGTLDGDGRLRANLPSPRESALNDEARFTDLTYIAFLTDPATNRTEQRRFDIRVSREAIHIYPVQLATGPAGGLYLAAYHADGTPAVCDLAARASGREVAAGRTNRFGVARLEIPSFVEAALEVRARGPAGAGTLNLHTFRDPMQNVTLATSRALYRRGEPIRVTLTSNAPALRGMLLVSDDSGALLWSRAVELRGGTAEAVVPYDARFLGQVRLAFVTPREAAYNVTRVVIYPGPAPDAFRVAVHPQRDTYRPGERAVVSLEASRGAAPVEAAFGVAVVDQSVFERAGADRSRWSLQEDGIVVGEQVGGVSVSDLRALPPSAIDADYQLVAEALLGITPLRGRATTYAEDVEENFKQEASIGLQVAHQRLNDAYRRNLQAPRDEESLSQITGYSHLGPADPWKRPYRVRFSTEAKFNVIEFLCGGPDKTFDTGDDFVALRVRREWFFSMEAIIREALSKQPDYPATVEELNRLLEQSGILGDRLRDPWGHLLKASINHDDAQRIIGMHSPGPDGAWDSDDDFRVTEWRGSYFRSTESAVGDVLEKAAVFPGNREELFRVASAGNVALAEQRDPWGSPYSFSFRADVLTGQRFRIYTYAEYQRSVQQRREPVEINRVLRLIEVRSNGPDRVAGTYDDFTVASWHRLADEGAANVEPAAPAGADALAPGDAGAITGVVTDPTGAAVGGAEVLLNGRHRTECDTTGRYWFRGVAPGMHHLHVWSRGFQTSRVASIPVGRRTVTQVDIELQIGSVTESVVVAASPARLNTQMGFLTLGQGPAISTPRVREYFPETMFWAPELTTDAAGRTTLNLQMADSITTWRVLATASTVNGEIGEAVADIRAFQPFFAELDPPASLTAGDEITLPVPVRNYLEREQTVTLDLRAPPALAIGEGNPRSLRIAPAGSENATVRLRAASPSPGAALRVTARGAGVADAIEKSIAIHPDGEPVERSVTEFLSDRRPLTVDIPTGAIADSLRGEVKLYGNVTAHIIESFESMLRVPTGCGEQTISSAYPNLLFLRAIRDGGRTTHPLEARARRFLTLGYRRLLGYRSSEGGFAYWHDRTPDPALTAYALAFLQDAGAFIDVDREVIESSSRWLARQEIKEVKARMLALSSFSGAGPGFTGRLEAEAPEIARRGDAYAAAAFALAALKANRADLAAPAIERLRSFAREAPGGLFFSVEDSTPFYGGGRAAILETTALAVSALVRWRAAGNPDPVLDTLIARAAAFLLRGKGANGLWLNTQATVRVFFALLETMAARGTPGEQPVEILVNGQLASQARLPGPEHSQAPVILDVARFLRPGARNTVEVRAPSGRFDAQVQFTARWYTPWQPKRSARTLDVAVEYSATETLVNEPVRCAVRVRRPQDRYNYGMVIVEAGLPPGAEVDRGGLAALARTEAIHSFEVAPDRVTFYVWASRAGFDFVFRPRYPMRAWSAASRAYDYYDPEERVVVAPVRFLVREQQ